MRATSEHKPKFQRGAKLVCARQWRRRRLSRRGRARGVRRGHQPQSSSSREWHGNACPLSAETLGCQTIVTPPLPPSDLSTAREPRTRARPGLAR